MTGLSCEVSNIRYKACFFGVSSSCCKKQSHTSISWAQWPESATQVKRALTDKKQASLQFSLLPGREEKAGGNQERARRVGEWDLWRSKVRIARWRCYVPCPGSVEDAELPSHALSPHKGVGEDSMLTPVMSTTTETLWWSE